MRHIHQPPKEYKHSALLDDLNEMMIRIKMRLHPQVGVSAFGPFLDAMKYPRPTIQELDELTNRIRTVLMEDSKEMRKY